MLSLPSKSAKQQVRKERRVLLVGYLNCLRLHCNMEWTSRMRRGGEECIKVPQHGGGSQVTRASEASTRRDILPRDCHTWSRYLLSAPQNRNNK